MENNLYRDGHILYPAALSSPTLLTISLSSLNLTPLSVFALSSQTLWWKIYPSNIISRPPQAPFPGRSNGLIQQVY